ncbi:DUF1990 domain-containing protein [Glaciihabitans arcticus]|uniref:DUF1990 domain-containing protein n=1 Tax=Glaciihabitans arcticus TaxID=2668039 RepID=A0A4Q9GQ34_9MICO|nr:DUF1990 domain-containing protein [Glaciihabitans arcticus]TBN56972.1 DUF1990 domain-containing protein [Glaciihabitans arcticus]
MTVPAANFPFAGITLSEAPAPPGYRLVSRRTLLTCSFEDALPVLMTWGIKTRAGFRVSSSAPVAVGDVLEVRLGPVREPVRVAWVTSAGFGYETLVGHPLAGEEAFLLETDSLGRLWFVNRSISRPVGAWRLVAWPLRLAQAFFVRRYGRVMESS